MGGSRLYWPASFDNITVDYATHLLQNVTSNEFKRWLEQQECTFEGKGSHLKVRLGKHCASLPMHGKKELGTGLVNTIKKQFGLIGEDEDEALMHALDALETALSMYVDDRRDVPRPSAVKCRGNSVIVPALTEAKLALYSAMRAQKIGKAELARRLNCHLPQVDRLLDLLHRSRLDQLEAAFRVIGKRLTIAVEEAA